MAAKSKEKQYLKDPNFFKPNNMVAILKMFMDPVDDILSP